MLKEWVEDGIKGFWWSGRVEGLRVDAIWVLCVEWVSGRESGWKME